MGLGPKAVVTDEDRERGLHHLMLDAGFATVVGTLNSGVVLVAYAMHLGAPNTIIGFLAAVPFLTQLLQAPAVGLVEKWRTRRLISVGSLFLGRLALPLMAVLGFVPDTRIAIALLVLCEIVHCGFNAVGACSWNSWMRDLVPSERLGRFFAQRSLWATGIGLIGSLGAGFALERAGGATGGDWAFFALYGLGFLASLVSTWQLSKVPEPKMPRREQAKVSLFTLLRAPLRDRNFRRLIMFLCSWQFAVNLATPFFTVFFVRQLGFGMGFVMTLSVVSQIANILVLQSWGQISDRFSNKVTLGWAAPALVACIAAMAFVSSMESKAEMGAFLIGLHAIMGMAAAGVGLGTGAIALKLAPVGSGTAYVAASALTSALAAGLAPILGGLFADFFARRELSFGMFWTSPAGRLELMALHFTRWDFYFLGAALLGLYACHRLSLVDEPGAVRKRVAAHQIMLQTRRNIRNLSPVAGLRLATAFPAGALIDVRERRRARERMAAKAKGPGSLQGLEPDNRRRA